MAWVPGDPGQFFEKTGSQQHGVCHMEHCPPPLCIDMTMFREYFLDTGGVSTAWCVMDKGVPTQNLTTQNLTPPQEGSKNAPL